MAARNLARMLKVGGYKNCGHKRGARRRGACNRGGCREAHKLLHTRKLLMGAKAIGEEVVYLKRACKRNARKRGARMRKAALRP